ncbi:potassium channel family protein [Marinococcus halotolerans]|uniref:potassium channel family protein n=1 Tax=Marinococcus halotolerans TaxID=301092 RepID=UPI0003B54318|nr:potassium channel family protein [Marinococcus halotolerans]
MHPFYLITGILLLMLTIIDLIWTIFWVERGAGPITRHLTSVCWLAWRKITRGRSRWFSLSGPLILSATLLSWILLLWLSWTLIFVGGEAALTDTQNRGSTDWGDQIYFVGYTMVTLGIGDFVPSSPLWQVLTILVSASGMLFITMSASYVISVLSALNQKRSFADSITGLGPDSVSIVSKAWNGRDFTNYDLFLVTYASQLSTVAAQHNAYPILHYYHSANEEKALTRAVALFDDSLTILTFSVPEPSRPNRVLLHNARSSVRSYIESQDFSYIPQVGKAPPVPNLAILRRENIPVFSARHTSLQFSKLENRRKQLYRILRSDARTWPEK